MPEQFLHGAEVVEITDGARPISTVSASVIGLVGIAPDADALLFPLNTPVLVTSKAEAAKLAHAGTLMSAIDGIYDQTGAVVVVVRVEEGADEAATLTNLVGGVNATTGDYEGVQAFLGAESVLGVSPRLLVAPGYTHQRPDSNANPVVAELIGIADRLRAVILADGPNTNDADAITYRGDFGSRRVYVVDPQVKVFKEGAVVVEPASAGQPLLFLSLFYAVFPSLSPVLCPYPDWENPCPCPG